ncbi:hypothetical protein POM88_029617 [Heracleum sosnowskyi]|uniref:Integrase zinc-binding domain-containing protein n=1 Tax=Heracleum sosnowskyi TaxID=360622 RepID=A0AAD8HV81_9APIA|nr:hypothetical protein POM88_029617 [Heracleum sosnowskyi]
MACTDNGAQNNVVDALSRKVAVKEFVNALTMVNSDFVELIRTLSGSDETYKKLMKDVRESIIRKYWIKNGLLHAKGNMLYVPCGGNLRLKILWESHDSKWDGHPGVERIAQFCYNLQRSSSPGHSPFEMVLGVQPRTPNEAAIQRTGGNCPTVYRRHKLFEDARDSLSQTQYRMRKYVDKKRRPLEFQVGDKVLLTLTPQIWKKISSKTAKDRRQGAEAMVTCGLSEWLRWWANIILGC